MQVENLRYSRVKLRVTTALLLLALGTNWPKAAKGADLVGGAAAQPENGAEVIERTREQIRDHIYGGWVGMLIGGIEGLAHEFKYIEQPRQELPDYQFLPEGARTDDDNDIEWAHLYFMDREQVIKIPYPRLTEIWEANMNQGVWCANERARKLMDQGLQPPETSDPARNSFSSYNLAGQFTVESYGLIAPGMPQTAADIGLHYARVAVSGEPLQAAQFWTTLVSLASVSEDSMEDLLRKSLQAIDSTSAQAEAIAEGIEQFHAHPQDWKAARQHFHAKWFIKMPRTAPGKWNDNSTPLNGAMVALALLYGKGDFYKTGQYAMALGYDADCNAATACAVVGAHIGFAAIAKLPNFHMPDRYVNLTRPQLPKESSVSEQVDALLRICERVILANGGRAAHIGGKDAYRIRLQSPRLQQSLSGVEKRAAVPNSAENPAAADLAKYQSELQTFRAEFGGSRELPDTPFFLFGMGNRTKLLYKAGSLVGATASKVLRRWPVKNATIVPPGYYVAITTTAGTSVRIVEDEQAVWIEENGIRQAIEGTQHPVHLPGFNEYRYPQVLSVLHQELLVNVIDGKPVPNFLVYPKPWYRDGALMAMCYKATGNLDLIRDWVLGLTEPYDRNNAGETEADNLGQALYLVSLVADKNHPLVQKVLEQFPHFEVVDPGGKYLKGRSDFSFHPVYQTKWAKYGLRALGLSDPYAVPRLADSYSALFWMDYRDTYVKSQDATDFSYPYLNWASDHFHGLKSSPISNRDYPLTWEKNASAANYASITILSDEYRQQRIAAPHTWHAAEVFLYLMDQK